jgi:microcompartment protein CcmK/EutM
MELARVIGSVSATLKDRGLQGVKLALVEPVDPAGVARGPAEVAADPHGSGVGELVLVVRGSAARQPEPVRGLPADLTIVAIVDQVAVSAAVAGAAEPATPVPAAAPAAPAAPAARSGAAKPRTRTKRGASNG